ncbi:MAG: exo-alpha-sialidase [Paludibacter sp.]
MWDTNTQVTIFGGNYGRVIQLKNGNLLGVAQNGNSIIYSLSTNKGASWAASKMIAFSPLIDSIANSVPDVIQLADGTILAGYNPRPKSDQNGNFSAKRKFGIRVRRSTDNCATWSNEIFIYNAQSDGAQGCWEPSFVELPSGEVQCFFANENDYATTNDQNISMCRSFDKGLTWSTPSITSYRAGHIHSNGKFQPHRDGMPVPLLLKNKNEIVYVIEDNGYVGIEPKLRPSVIRTTLADNWKSGFVNENSPNREIAFAKPLSTLYIAASPYICQLPSGETILSYQGSEGRTTNPDFFDMYVMVGNNEARQFKAKCTPFAVEQKFSAKWNSVAVINDGIVVAVTSTEGKIKMIKGFPVNQAFAKFGAITVDGQKTATEKWSTVTAEQLYFGSASKARCGVDFLYDNTYLYLTATVLDTLVVNNGTVNDGLRLMLDMDDVSTATPQKGTYNLFFDTNGKIKLQIGNNGTWNNNINTSTIKYAINIVAKKSYTIEAAIPWAVFGKNAPVMNTRMAVAVEMTNCNADTTIIEGIPDAKTDMPYTWLEFKLLANTTAIEDIDSNISVDILKTENSLKIKSYESIKSIHIYSIEGKEIYSNSNVNNQELVVPFNNHFGIVRIILANGKIMNRKITN